MVAQVHLDASQAGFRALCTLVAAAAVGIIPDRIADAAEDRRDGGDIIFHFAVTSQTGEAQSTITANAETGRHKAGSRRQWHGHSDRHGATTRRDRQVSGDRVDGAVAIDI